MHRTTSSLPLATILAFCEPVFRTSVETSNIVCGKVLVSHKKTADFQFFSNHGALRNLLVVDLFDDDCDCACKWKNLYEFLEIDLWDPLDLGTFPHIVPWIE